MVYLKCYFKQIRHLSYYFYVKVSFLISAVARGTYPSTLAWLLPLPFSIPSTWPCSSSLWYLFASTHIKDLALQQKKVLSHLFAKMLQLLSVLLYYLDLAGDLDWQLAVVHQKRPLLYCSFFSQSLLDVRDYSSLFSMAFERQKLETSGRGGFSQWSARHLTSTAAERSWTQLQQLPTWMSPLLQVRSTYRKQEHNLLMRFLKCM